MVEKRTKIAIQQENARNVRVKLDINCLHARETACVEGWCAKWAKRKHVDVICIVTSCKLQTHFGSEERRKKKRRKKKGEKKRSLVA